MTLVDTLGRGVERVTETGLVFDGVEYEVDCIIFATGFEVGTAYTRRSGFEVYGRGGRKLTDYWSSGLRTLHGFYSHGFPNCFHLGITQNTLTPNFPHMLDEQARHVADVVKTVSEQQAQMVEPTLRPSPAGWKPFALPQSTTSPSDRPVPRATTMVKAALGKAKACSTVYTAPGRTPSSPS